MNFSLYKYIAVLIQGYIKEQQNRYPFSNSLTYHGLPKLNGTQHRYISLARHVQTTEPALCILWPLKNLKISTVSWDTIVRDKIRRTCECLPWVVSRRLEYSTIFTNSNPAFHAVIAIPNPNIDGKVAFLSDRALKKQPKMIFPLVADYSGVERNETVLAAAKSVHNMSTAFSKLYTIRQFETSLKEPKRPSGGIITSINDWIPRT